MIVDDSLELCKYAKFHLLYKVLGQLQCMVDCCQKKRKNANPSDFNLLLYKTAHTGKDQASSPLLKVGGQSATAQGTHSKLWRKPRIQQNLF